MPKLKSILPVAIVGKNACNDTVIKIKIIGFFNIFTQWLSEIFACMTATNSKINNNDSISHLDVKKVISIMTEIAIIFALGSRISNFETLFEVFSNIANAVPTLF